MIFVILSIDGKIDIVMTSFTNKKIVSKIRR
jgi:hypothetical protein